MIPNILGATVPVNFWGSEYAHSGVGYAGFGISVLGLGAEYIQTELIRSLDSGKAYCLTFYLSLSDSIPYAMNQIGGWFRTESLFTSTSLPISDQDVQVSTGPEPIVKSIGWQEFNLRFIADSAYRFLVLGRFGIPGENDTIHFPGRQVIGHTRFSYYYVDDVSVMECEDASLPNVITPNGDGLNDRFCFPAGDTMQSIRILNRWGQTVYRQQFVTGWDGRIEDEPAQDGIYYYIVYSNNVYYKGYVEVIR